MIHLTKFYQEIRTSSSLPLLVEGDDEIKYVIKLRGGADGAIANIIEWLSLQFARLIEIPTLIPKLLIIDENLAQQVENTETREIIEKSIGINFGTVYIENSRLFQYQDIYKIDNHLKEKIFLYDLFLLNIDRSLKNTNMLFCQQNQLFCFDYTSSMAMRFILKNINQKYSDTLGKQIKRHPFYDDEISVNNFIQKIESISPEKIFDIIKEIPDTWLSQLNIGNDYNEIVNVIWNNLLHRIKDIHFIDDNLKLLKNIQIESEEEGKMRASRNKQLFIDNFGKL